MEVDVALSGSSTKIPGHAGFINGVEKNLIPVRVSGTSGGAITAALWSLYGAEEAAERIFDFDFSKVFKLSWMALFRYIVYGYASKGEKLYEALKEAFGDTTFSSSDLEFDVYVAASDMTNGRLVVYSRETSPDLELATAVYRSACMPGVFRPIDDGPNKIRDGSVYRDLPIDIWDDFPRPRIGHVFGNQWRPQSSETWHGFKELQLTLARVTDDNLDATLEKLQVSIPHDQEVYISTGEGFGLNMLNFKVDNDLKYSLYTEGERRSLSIAELILDKDRA